MRRIVSLLIHMAIAVITVIVVFKLTLRSDNGVLVSAGMDSMKYFTTLSNVLQGLCSMVMVTALIGRFDKERWVAVLRWAGVTAVTITLLTVIFFLGPTMGYQHMFDGSSLWLHLILPLAAILAFVVLDRDAPLTVRHIPWAAAPMVLYAVFYTVNIALGGMKNDFYGFVRGNWALGAVSITVMLAADIAIAALLRWIRKRGGKPFPPTDPPYGLH